MDHCASRSQGEGLRCDPRQARWLSDTPLPSTGPRPGHYHDPGNQARDSYRPWPPLPSPDPPSPLPGRCVITPIHQDYEGRLAGREPSGGARWKSPRLWGRLRAVRVLAVRQNRPDYGAHISNRARSPGFPGGQARPCWLCRFADHRRRRRRDVGARELNLAFTRELPTKPPPRETPNLTSPGRFNP